MFYNLRPYQLLAVKKIFDDRRVIVADDMGLGKSAEAIGAKHLIDEKEGQHPALVVCPMNVMPHWNDEIQQWYYKGGKTKIASLYAKTFERDVTSVKNRDFVVTSYSVLSTMNKYPERAQQLLEAGFSYGILDEGHNAKNPKSLRAMAVREVFHRIPYLAILTGTPIPNSVVDIFSQLNLIGPNNFPIEGNVPEEMIAQFYDIIREKPHLVRDVLHACMLRRTADKYLHKKMPLLEQQVREFALSGLHEQVYNAIYENDDIPPAHKLGELVKATIDPNLVQRRFLPEHLQRELGKIESSTYKQLEKIIEEAVNDGGKVVGFTDLKTNVVNKLVQKFSRYGAGSITGDIESTNNKETDAREAIRRKFQRDPTCRVLFVTKVGNEGVDYTAGTHVVHINVPYTSAEIEQRNRRCQRASAEIEKNKVASVILNPKLSNGSPTITEGILQLIEEKRRIINSILESPENITLDDLMHTYNGHPEKHPTISQYLSPKNFMDFHLASLRGKGGLEIARAYAERPWMAQNLAIAYCKYWEGYFGGNAMTLTSQMLQKLIDLNNSTRIIDIASGPFSLSRRIQMPLKNVDLNPYMLQAGKILEEQEIIPAGNIGIEGLAHDLDFFEEGEFDVANCSLALHMTSLKELDSGYSERERVFREANRIIAPNGIYIFTLPASVIHYSDLSSFTRGAAHLGFKVLPETGFYTAPPESKSRFKVFFGALRKEAEPSNTPVAEGLLRWKMDEKLDTERKGATKNKRKGFARKRKKEAYEIVNEFHKVDNGLIGGVA